MTVFLSNLQRISCRPRQGELTRLFVGSYARCMSRYWGVGLLLIAAAVVQGAPVEAAEPPPIPPEDYALYDHVVTKKFLTSDTRLVVLERMTVARLIPNHEGPMTIALIQDQGYFSGELPSELVRDFVAVNQDPARLEGRFQFGVRYRFVSGNTMEEPEVRSAFPAAYRAVPTQGSPVIDRLAFSRVGRTLRNDQALVFVENTRPDGTGAGFLVWFRRQGRDWTIYDTEVVWTVRNQEDGEGPLLAP